MCHFRVWYALLNICRRHSPDAIGAIDDLFAVIAAVYRANCGRGVVDSMPQLAQLWPTCAAEK